LCGLCFSTSSVHLAAVRLQERAGIAVLKALFEKQLKNSIPACINNLGESDGLDNFNILPGERMFISIALNVDKRTLSIRSQHCSSLRNFLPKLSSEGYYYQLTGLVSQSLGEKNEKFCLKYCIGMKAPNVTIECDNATSNLTGLISDFFNQHKPPVSGISITVSSEAMNH
ncbi:hypothetical protein, partial [uncultured Endozoicomonas sp.]|uniref:hypothetical protein n=1 Tax=uncultured Endozoicomonas sp. TaxID=432652 RepID=UPI00262AB0D6